MGQITKHLGLAYLIADVALHAVMALGQGFSPNESAQRMEVAEGFQVSLVAAEPLVRQPVGEPQLVPTAEIDRLLDASVSLMPENLYVQLKPQELRDLLAYLQSKP